MIVAVIAVVVAHSFVTVVELLSFFADGAQQMLVVQFIMRSKFLFIIVHNAL